MTNYDDVRGTVIGGDFVSWQLFYEGRPQSGREMAANDADATGQAKTRLEEMRLDWRFYELYPNRAEDAWEVRIW